VEARTFEDQLAAAEYLAANLPAHLSAVYGSSIKAAGALIDVFDEPVFSETPSGESRRAVIPSLRWVIRDEDLGLFESVSRVLQATATGAAVLVPTGSPVLAAAPPAIEIVTQVIKTGFAIRAKGATLDEAEFQVLMLLREQKDGLSIQQMREKLPATKPFDTDASLEALLHHLEKYPTHSSNVSLVWRSAAGLWYAQDV